MAKIRLNLIYFKKALNLKIIDLVNTRKKVIPVVSIGLLHLAKLSFFK